MYAPYIFLYTDRSRVHSLVKKLACDGRLARPHPSSMWPVFGRKTKLPCGSRKTSSMCLVCALDTHLLSIITNLKYNQSRFVC